MLHQNGNPANYNQQAYREYKHRGGKMGKPVDTLIVVLIAYQASGNALNYAISGRYKQ